MPLQAVSIILIQAFPDMPADDLDQIEDQVVVFRAREQAVAEVVAHERLLAQREQPHHALVPFGFGNFGKLRGENAPERIVPGEEQSFIKHAVRFLQGRAHAVARLQGVPCRDPRPAAPLTDHPLGLFEQGVMFPQKCPEPSGEVRRIGNLLSGSHR